MTSEAFRADVLAGFAQPQKAVPARWLYDDAGSTLFDAITALPEYYPTRTETALLRTHAADMAARIGAGGALIEFGAGSSAKTPLLLAPLKPAMFVPIDISGDHLRAAAAVLARDFPAIEVAPREGDFMAPPALPARARGLARTGFFPGSTIGNLVPPTAVDLLRCWRDYLGEGARLLIGFDRIKPIAVLVPAYDDSAGVTAAFNRNLLTRINRELGGDMPVDAFAHEARWNDALARIEMHLVAQRAVAFSVAGSRYAMAAGETIHTENSHKYDLASARTLLAAGCWTPIADWSDAAGWFSVVLAEAQPLRSAP